MPKSRFITKQKRLAMDKQLEDINTRLERAVETKRDAERLEAKLATHVSDRRRLRPKVKELCKILEAEIEDVEKLRKLSFKSVLATMLRQKEKWEQKEWQEYLEADLKHTRYSEALEIAEAEAARLEGQLAALGDWRQQYQSLMDQKMATLQSINNPAGAKLMELKQKASEAKADGKELREAISAGNDAIEALQPMAEKLASARNWGIWDMAGGGLISSAIKHDKIKGARSAALQAQGKLDRFRTELADVGDKLGQSVEFGVTMKTVDIFFDNIFIDWMVQSKVRSAQAQCEQTMHAVQNLVGECQRKLAETQRQVEKFNAEYDRLLETA
jgi:hypothetical protein